jgi:hypothetical protein
MNMQNLDCKPNFIKSKLKHGWWIKNIKSLFAIRSLKQEISE